MNSDAQVSTLSILFAVLFGIVAAGYLSDRTYIPLLAALNSQRAVDLRYMRHLEGERQELQLVVLVLKAREDRIVEETLEGLGLPQGRRAAIKPALDGKGGK
jgi:hypothetical protein